MNDADENGVLNLIGHTPVVEIKAINKNPSARILAKLEGFNPCSSVKDRIALYMLEGAERRGELKGGMTILEPTSGNTGIGLAMVASVKGYKAKIVMPETMSVERQRTLKALGAELVLTPGAEGMNGAIEMSRVMSSDPRYYMPNQFANPDNVRAHYEGTGQEILEQTDKVDVLVVGIGTGGTLMGVTRKLRERDPGLKAVAVEPFVNSQIQGLRNFADFMPPIFDVSILDEKVNVDDRSAFEMTHTLACEAGLFVGISSGAAMCEAVRQASMMKSGTVLVIFPDRGDRYLSTECFNYP
ncbi:MAG: cysteine synthase B [Candidatus Anoxymicrobium japonicum]|uniref:Cysteine synthase B n=1 Tax=Candidatus Anoxymicrobium japonicum TaxID=2013648 RepID=A0A2N3G6H4_9ACTN|nr:MAG: cysteine synthase B [Candidatus Anoxymicrobium japonicum]